MDPQIPRQPPAPGSKMEKRKLRVLYAEDDEIVRKVVSALLKMKYTDVEVAKNGTELFEKLTAPGASYDCVVSDDNMPGKRGQQVFEEIKDMDNLRNLPFVLITAVPDPATKQKMEKNGGACVFKPVGKDALYAAVEGLVKPKE